LSGVRFDEIARFVPYELGFVLLPGWLVYRALMRSPGGRLRQIVFGWSLGYVLEILAFIATAASGMRSLFVVYPVVVGLPAALIARHRRASSRREKPAQVGRVVSIRWIAAGAILCCLLLVYPAAVGFEQTPLPRDVSGATYHEDTVFTLSLAAEALHHWPVTVPMVAGEPLHYHLFVHYHLAAIAQVTGIDLSVVVMRLYIIPLLVLFTLQLGLAGRRIGRASSVGLIAAFLVLFFGELDASRTRRFLFNDFFFNWLLSSHTFLLGLTFFIPTVVLLDDLIASRNGLRRQRVGAWLLVTALFAGCIGAKSYSMVALGAGLLVMIVWQFWRDRTLNRSAVLALFLAGSLYIATVVLIFKGNSAGLIFSPFEAVKRVGGVDEVSVHLGNLWGSTDVSSVLRVAYATFGLIGIPLVGIGLLLHYRRLALSASEVWLLSLFVAALPTLFLLDQPGYGQLFVVYFGVVPGLILGAAGLSLFWRHHGRASAPVAALVIVAAAVWLVATTELLDSTWYVELQLTLLFLAIVAVAALAPTGKRRIVLPAAAGVAFVALWPAPIVTTLVVFAVALLVASIKWPLLGHGLATAAVGSCLLLGLLNTPFDWFPGLSARQIDSPAYEFEQKGLTSGLYSGLLWVRNNSDSDAVLVVNNHSIYRDKRDSKYFYYSAFAQRRVVLESWDYTRQAAASGFFSLDEARAPFPRRLKLSNAVFRRADEIAIRTLARDYGARYLVVDKVHGTAASKWLPWRARPLFSNGDVDIYGVGKPVPPPSSCPYEQDAGVAAVFGHRRTVEAAHTLRQASERVGFPGLVIQQRGCRDYAVVLTGLEDFAQAKDFQRQAATVGHHVTLECRTQLPEGGLNAVFGHRRTRRAAEELAARANAAGFPGLSVRQDACGDWEVDLEGLETAAQRREFRLQAARVGVHVTFEPG
jgi:hypothetical protein